MTQLRMVGKFLVFGKTGQGLIEYGLVIGLIAIVVVAALTILGHHATHPFNNSILKNALI